MAIALNHRDASSLAQTSHPIHEALTIHMGERHIDYQVSGFVEGLSGQIRSSSRPTNANGNGANLSALMDESNRSYGLGRPQESLAHLAEALPLAQTPSQRHKVHALMARAHLDADHPEQAIAAADQASDWDEAMGLLKTRAHIRLGNLDAANEAFDSVEHDVPGYVNSQVNHAFELAMTRAMLAIAHGASPQQATRIMNDVADESRAATDNYCTASAASIRTQLRDRFAHQETLAKAEFQAFAGLHPASLRLLTDASTMPNQPPRAARVLFSPLNAGLSTEAWDAARAQTTRAIDTLTRPGP